MMIMECRCRVELEVAMKRVRRIKFSASSSCLLVWLEWRGAAWCEEEDGVKAEEGGKGRRRGQQAQAIGRPRKKELWLVDETDRLKIYQTKG
jgi:hypothetical protein